MNALLEAWTGLRLLEPWWLLLILLIPIALLLRRLRGEPTVRFAPAGLLVANPLPSTWRNRLSALPRLLQIGGLVFVALALARPAARVELPLESQGIDILLCLDVSSSMTANDLDARRTRLDVARSAAARFVAARPDDRIGLIGFARYPDVRCPLTLDHAALEGLLAQVDLVEEDGPEDATGIGTAVARAAQVLAGSQGRSRVVILLTDGEENVARPDAVNPTDEIAPVHAAQLCERLGVRVYAIAAGIGRRDPQGRMVPLDTGEVRRLAERTDGAFFEARDADALSRVYATIDRLETVAHREPRFRFEDRFLPFLCAALSVLLIGRLLRSTWLEVLP